MNMLVRIAPAAREGWSSVLVEVAHAEQLHRHFRSLHLSTTPVEDAIFRTVRVERDSEGIPRIITETIDRAFDVQAMSRSIKAFSLAGRTTRNIGHPVLSIASNVIPIFCRELRSPQQSS